ncbi:type VI secretion system protein IglI family protein [Francisella sp. SYW-9]|uniref:type VI secretion system protein IglI family protein n=1 Tax=Francisella sp. SYW-9 TaxID=2610888 RepID=UPI00123CF46F|nr:type VI secretion system protein IglI family protein [Francisella sp. SYW-9]
MSKASEELNDLFRGDQGWEVIKRSNFEVLTECTEFIEGRKFHEVIKAISEYVQEDKVLDIQFFCLYLQAYLNLNHSADDFVTTLEALAEILGKYELISPINKKDMIVIRSIISLTNEANDALNYYKTDISNTQLDLIKTHIGEIYELLNSSIEKADLAEFNKSKNQFLITASKYLIKEEGGAQETPEVEEKPPTSSDENKDDRYSFHWANLLLKISRFSKLASSPNGTADKFEQSLLFDSIQTEIQKFNPIKYFPREFQVFLNAVTPETYTAIQQVIEGSKGSPLWGFMLKKVEANIEVDPDNMQVGVGDFNVDNILELSNQKTMAENNYDEEGHNNYELDHGYSHNHQDDDFDSAFDLDL